MTTRKRMSRREQLQAAWDAAADLMVAELTFVPFRGWFAVPDEARWFCDDGEPLGTNWREALETISELAKPVRMMRAA